MDEDEVLVNDYLIIMGSILHCSMRTWGTGSAIEFI